MDKNRHHNSFYCYLERENKEQEGISQVTIRAILKEMLYPQLTRWLLPPNIYFVIVCAASIFLLRRLSSYDGFQLYLSYLISSKTIILEQTYKEWADGQ